MDDARALAADLWQLLLARVCGWQGELVPVSVPAQQQQQQRR